MTSAQFNQGGTLVEQRGYAYDPVGLITNVTRLNNVSVDYGYDPVGQLISAQAYESGGTPRWNEQFGYGNDASHNLALRTNHTLVQAFSSNARNELENVVREGTLTVAGSVTGAVTTLSVNGTTATLYSDQTFATTSGLTLQDGNNLFVTAGSNGAGALVVSTLEARKLPETVNFSYDLNGNLLNDGLKGYEYDDANQLVRLTVTNQWRSEFTYDGLGRRRIARDYSWGGASWTLTNEVRYVWDGMVVLQERDAANAVKVTYTRGLDRSSTRQGAGGIGGLLARTDANGTTYYHSDAGGNITAMTDGNGNLVARYLYDPFGNLLAKSGPMAEANHYRFSSKEVHPTSGLYYYGYRYYEPNLQRWLNEDPIGEAGGINLFEFVGNEPLNGIDDFGESKYNKSQPTTVINIPPASVAQWNHPIPWNNNSYKFHEHALVTGAGWTQNDLHWNQDTTLLNGHKGRHCETFLDEVNERLTVADRAVKPRTQPNCEIALKQVIKGLDEDIKSGDLPIYDKPKTVTPVKGVPTVPYREAMGSGFQRAAETATRVGEAAGRVAGPLGFLLMFYDMIFHPERIDLDMYSRDGGA